MSMYVGNEHKKRFFFEERHTHHWTPRRLFMRTQAERVTREESSQMIQSTSQSPPRDSKNFSNEAIEGVWCQRERRSEEEQARPQWKQWQQQQQQWWWRRRRRRQGQRQAEHESAHVGGRRD